MMRYCYGSSPDTSLADVAALCILNSATIQIIRNPYYALGFDVVKSTGIARICISLMYYQSIS